MDYTAAASEADALQSSPWGSSSPRAPRGFAQAAPDSPESPQATRDHSYNQSQNTIPGTPYLAPHSDITVSASGDGQAIGDRSQAQQQAEGPQHQRAAAMHQHENHAQQHGQQHPGQSQQRQGAARYHNARQNRPVPQYKLQAKVTALERSGRKDPVIRFDVYVCSAKLEHRMLLNPIYRPISPNSAPLNSEMSGEHMESSSSSPIT